MRALLDLLREHEAAGEHHALCLKPELRLHGDILQTAISHLKILDPEHGDKELVNSVAAELAK